MKKECCVMVYNSFGDPLFQNVMLPLMRTLSAGSGWCFHLITFEQPFFAISEDRRRLLAGDLKAQGIRWYPRKHHTGKLLIARKAWDVVSVGMVLTRLRMKGVGVIWSFANVAASIAWVYGRVLSYRTVIYSYEPHSEFMKELGIWSGKSWNYRVLSALERRAGRDADYLMTGTRYMVEHLTAQGIKGEVYRAPTSADDTKFYPVAHARKTLEERYGIKAADKVFLYLGKFGGLYYASEVMRMFGIMAGRMPDCRFIVITPNPYDEILDLCREARFDPGRLVYITRPPVEDIRVCISGADLGVTAIPPTPSQRYRSPTKVAEYLMCGLPYITTAGVSEDDVIATKYGVGVVVKDFSVESIADAVPAIEDLLLRDREKLSRRCREVGLMYRGKDNVDKILKHIFERLADSG